MAGKSIKVGDVLLDLENPRISGASSQREALQKILQDQDVKLLALADSIIQDGLNPMDRLLVIKSKVERSKFVVIEGNRRLAALKILGNPAVLAGMDVRPALQRRLESAARNFNDAIKSLECFELPDRAAGAMWIRQRHTGENDGRGIVSWGGIARARFRGNDPALQALDLVLAHGELTEDEKAGIEERFPITTLDRLLSTPAVRALIGVSVQKSKLTTSLPPEEVIKPLRRIVRALATGSVNVTGLKRREQQIEWVSALGSDLPDLTKASGPLRPVETLEEQDFKPAPPPEPAPPAPTPKPKPKPKAVVRKTLIPASCSLTVDNPKIATIAGELRRLPLTEFPHAISVLFRVFLEQSVDHYLDKEGIPLRRQTQGAGLVDKKLKEKVQGAVEQLVTSGVPRKDLDGVSKGIADPNNPLCVDTLHNYVHNRFYSPQERELKVAWDNAQLFFEKIWP